MGTLTNAHLNRYYAEEVQIKREMTQRAVATVLPIVDRLISEMHKEDDRFPAKLSGNARVGSQFQGLKVKRADEFDFSVPIQGLPPMSWVQPVPRYYRYEQDVESKFETLPENVRLVDYSVPLPTPTTGFMAVTNVTSGPIAAKDGRSDIRLIYNGDVIPFQTKQLFKKALQAAIRKVYPPEGKLMTAS